eukprot:4165131-Amphidinium_carterae.1
MLRSWSFEHMLKKQLSFGSLPYPSKRFASYSYSHSRPEDPCNSFACMCEQSVNHFCQVSFALRGGRQHTTFLNSNHRQRHSKLNLYVHLHD